MKKKSLYLTLVLVAALGGAYFLSRERGAGPQPPSTVHTDQICAERNFERVSYFVCMADPAEHRIRLSRLQPDGNPNRSLTRLAQAARAKGKALSFAMNAGMYHEDMSPVGLYVEEGRELAALQIGEGDGNFYFKPNGVFFVTRDGRAAVLTTEDYAREKPDAFIATQSGPMLVVNGALHPKFEENGQSRFIRNGVGVRSDGRVMFAISRTEVSFGSFARLFRDALDCPDALYFDGVVAAFSDGKSTLVGGSYPAGPIVSVTEE